MTVDYFFGYLVVIFFYFEDVAISSNVLWAKKFVFSPCVTVERTSVISILIAIVVVHRGYLVYLKLAVLTTVP